MYRKAFFNKKYLVYVWSKESAYLTTMNEKKIIRMKVFLLLNSSIYLGLKIHVIGLNSFGNVCGHP